MDRRRSRRDFLIGSGVVGAAGIAGCTSLGRETDDEGPATAGATVVSQHHRATDAGLEVLAEGGTAADAAVAVATTLSVVEPWFSSALGGGTWALYYDADAETVTSVDGVGPVGSEATRDDFAARADEAGIHQAVVPGAWDGWMLWLEAYGTLDLESVLEPAITTAREGYPVSEGMQSWLEDEADEIDDRPAAASIYAPEGDLLEEGETVYQAEMAETFTALAEAYADQERRSEGIQAARDYFYRGPVAEAIVEVSAANDGYLTREDFERFEAEIVEPISIEYDEAEELRVYQNPPNSQGITQLLALNILKGDDLSELEPADALHLQVEAIKLAFADRYHHVGDPDRVDVPVADLLSEEYAEAQRDRIEMETAMEWPLDAGLSSSSSASREADGGGPSASASAGADGANEAHTNTSTFHIVDADGNAAAVTTSLGAQFLVIGDTGIHINNRMRMLALEPDNPNRLTPGYKVRHTSNPFMATREGTPYILGGTTGVDTQPQGQLQQFVHAHEFGRDAQETVEQPRFVSTAFPSTQYPYEFDNTLQLEAEFPSDVIADLEDRGHEVTVGAGVFGTANMLRLGADEERIEVGAEPRVDTASGESLADR